MEVNEYFVQYFRFFSYLLIDGLGTSMKGSLEPSKLIKKWQGEEVVSLDEI